MCGICGIYKFDNTKILENEIKIMNDAMIFRGPDDHGYLLNNNFGFAMRRLSIIDIHNGKQPIHDETSSYSIILNGEIYNYIELKNELKKKNIKFRTDSDTEVLLKSYIHFGDNFIDKVNGIFSFCIYDINKNKVLIYRDRFGVKPLYYYKSNKEFIFSSNLDSLSKYKKNLKINYESVFSYLSLNYVPNNLSIFSEVNKLLPGCFIKIENNQFTVDRYWSASPKRIKKNFDYEKIKFLLEDSIKIQSRSDVKIGTFLSGGVDSSILTYLLSKNIKNLETLTINFEDKIDDEDKKYALLLSKELKLKSSYLDINSNSNIIDKIDEIIPFLDEPLSDTAIFPTFLISQMSRQMGFKVMITGAGGDEIFGGYKRHFQKYIYSNYIPQINLNLLLNMSNFFNSDLNNYFLKIFSKHLNYTLGSSGTNFNLIKSIVKEKSLFYKNLIKLNSDLKKNYSRINNQSVRMEMDLNNYLPDNILPVVDKLSMSSSIEVRTPFLDHRLVDEVYNVDFGLDYNIKSKEILKKIYNANINTNIWNRKKNGFNFPINLWLQKNKHYIAEYIQDEKNEILDNIFNKKKLLEILSKKNIRPNHSQSIFSIYILLKWIKKNESN